jgi:hypothetical protein
MFRKRTKNAAGLWKKDGQQPIQNENYNFNFYPPSSDSSITCFVPNKVSRSVPSDIVRDSEPEKRDKILRL